ncbi:GAF and ANTAR domain-containing protein [Streptomyces endophyticus]|uniref:GAF and ANTAR domain-containing protein n=1 Tax=Streptomyces endophyticus TaxID=714166 RepID=A0ABU6F2N6_9ACTN|nr:GAF and ANTAR domain-containing protein [Streptomyces endophyticus]MEB8337092.1 GAF and ANTAR domain-containing protein [Streptomyces endophyticus]
MSGETSELRLAVALLEYSEIFRDAFDPPRYLRRLTDHCVDLLGALGAGVLLARPYCPTPASHRSEQQEDVRELVASDSPASPAHDTLQTGRAVAPVKLGAATTAARWPAFTAIARRRGIVYAYAVPLREADDLVGALAVFQAEPSACKGEFAIAQVLADAATTGLHNHRVHARYQDLTEQLGAALASRVRIEQAKGMLAERWATAPDAAFMALRRYARSNRLPLDQVAHAVIRRTLPDGRVRPDPS